MPVFLRGSWTIAVVVAAAGVARADLCPVRVDQAAPSIPVFVNPRAVAPATGPTGLQASPTAMRWDPSSLMPACRGDVPGEAKVVKGEPVIREMPASPGSARLLLSAMLGVGSWHLVRSARHFHWSALPDWYHAGGPLQIGESVPLDFDFSALPVRGVERVGGETGNPCVFYRARRGQHPRCDDQAYLMIQGPRGPPCLRSWAQSSSLR